MEGYTAINEFVVTGRDLTLSELGIRYKQIDEKHKKPNGVIAQLVSEGYQWIGGNYFDFYNTEVLDGTIIHLRHRY